jgi:hypothetical protein
MMEDKRVQSSILSFCVGGSVKRRKIVCQSEPGDGEVSVTEAECSESSDINLPGLHADREVEHREDPSGCYDDHLYCTKETIEYIVPDNEAG